MKKFLFFLAAVCLLLFAGCTPNGTPENSENTENPLTMYVTVGDNTLKATLANNSSVDALVALLQEGDITFSATENGGFEIYGNIGHTLPTNNTRITAEVGDILLYNGNNLCFFFGKNSYSYTRIGKINGYTMSELRALLCAEQGTVQVKISLNQ